MSSLCTALDITSQTLHCVFRANITIMPAPIDGHDRDVMAHPVEGKRGSVRSVRWQAILIYSVIIGPAAKIDHDSRSGREKPKVDVLTQVSLAGFPFRHFLRRTSWTAPTPTSRRRSNSTPSSAATTSGGPATAALTALTSSTTPTPPTFNPLCRRRRCPNRPPSVLRRRRPRRHTGRNKDTENRLPSPCRDFEF